MNGMHLVAADIFIDTNVLVYAAEGADRARAEIAQSVIELLRTTGRGVVSTQVLSEFARVVTERVPDRLTSSVAAEWVRGFAEAFRVIEVTPVTIAEALRMKERYTIALWDAQVLAAARLGLVGTLLSEDFSAGTDYDGIIAENPFLPEFDVDRLRALER